MSLKSVRDLDVWKLAIDLVKAVYHATESWPDKERFGLISQAQRAAVSVPANIAEGYARSHRGDYLRFLSMARGSLAELDTHLIIAHRLGYLTRTEAQGPWRLSQRVGRMLTRQVQGLSRAMESADTPNPKPQTPNPKFSARSARSRRSGPKPQDSQ